MRPIILSVICLLILTANTCNNECDDCHREIIIQNNSEDSVIMASRFYHYDLCALQGLTLKPGDTYTFDNKSRCWEDMLSNGRTKEVYIVDPEKFNNPIIFYNCDSIEEKNKVLKHYILTLDDLKRSNFTVTYP